VSERGEWEILLDRCLAGECSPDEEAEVMRRLAQSGEWRAILEALRVARARAAEGERQELPPDNLAPEDVKAAFERVGRRLGARPARPTLVRETPPGGVARVAWGWAAAAGVVVACALGGLATWVALRGGSASTAPVAVSYREYTTTRGERGEMRLLDGTRVTLNVDSRIRIPTTYGAGKREVTLVGEAYFDVVHDSTRPFAVRTVRGVVRDVGTRFDVQAYQEDSVERVAVAQGAVRVGSTALGAGDIAAVADTENVSVVHRANVARLTAWTAGRLELVNEPMRTAIPRIARWYDLDIRLEDPRLRDVRVSGSYGDEPVSQVIVLVAAAAGGRAEWRGRTVIVRGVQ
jgi:transmembrane sensor